MKINLKLKPIHDTQQDTTGPHPKQFSNLRSSSPSALVEPSSVRNTLPPRQPLPHAVIDPAKPLLKLGLDVHLKFIMAVAQKDQANPHALARPTPLRSPLATALRLAAQSLVRAQNYFGDLYRRWKARLGAPKAVTAMAHKLARVLWHLLKYKQAFDWAVFAKEEEKMKRKKLARLQNMAAAMNYQLIPNP